MKIFVLCAAKPTRDMEAVLSDSAPVYFNASGWTAFKEKWEEKQYSNLFVLADTHTAHHCIPLFDTLTGGQLDYTLITIPDGEANKNIETSTAVWQHLSKLGADRKSLLLNLGGGVVTDLGGFVAATYRRGIDFVNIPTSLLAMVDAALGGKTGVDLGALKNQVGLITPPELIWIVPEFLKTLPPRQLNNGRAEMLKHGLIADADYWSQLIKEDTAYLQDQMIRASVVIKSGIVDRDIHEQDLRKILNFGHTLGHAIESYYLTQKEDSLFHGEAIAAGMILEGFLSSQLTGLAIDQLHEIQAVFRNGFPKIDFDPADIEAILQLLRYDKKNTHGNINFVLLNRIGKAEIDVYVPNDLLYKAFAYYKDS